MATTNSSIGNCEETEEGDIRRRKGIKEQIGETDKEDSKARKGTRGEREESLAQKTQ